MCAMLGKLGICYEHAENGEQAVKKWAEGHFDLILMDCQMPIMDGFEATRLIRKNEDQNKIPIIALTANVLDADKQHCAEVGMDDHVAKPVVFETLKSVLQHWLSKKSNQVA